MLQERLNYVFILSIQNDITKSLSYDSKIREYVAKKQGKKVLQKCVSSLINISCNFSGFFNAFGICQLL